MTRLTLAAALLCALAMPARAEPRFYVRDTHFGCTSIRTNAYALTYGRGCNGATYVYEEAPYRHHIRGLCRYYRCQWDR